MNAIIIEQGNGFPSIGDYVADRKAGELYRVTEIGTHTITEENRGRSRYGTVEAVSWDDCPAGSEHTACVEIQADEIDAA